MGRMTTPISHLSRHLPDERPAPQRRGVSFLAPESQITRTPTGMVHGSVESVNGPAHRPVVRGVKAVLTVSAHGRSQANAATGQPAMITLGNAAKTLGISKPALSKAISRGHLSAHKREDGSFSIDPAELMRWWDGARHRFQGAAPVHAVSDFHETTASANSENTAVTPANGGNSADTDVGVAARLATLEEHVKGLRELLDEVKRSREQTEADRDHWRDQAARAVKALPAPESKISAEPQRRPWWRRLAG